MIKYIFYVLFFLYLYRLFPSFYGGVLFFPFFLFGMCLFLLVFLKKSLCKLHISVYFYLFFLWFSWYTFSSIINSTIDFSGIKQIIAALFSIALPIYLIQTSPKLRGSFSRIPFLELIAYCGATQGCLSVLFFFNRGILSPLHGMFLTDFHEKFEYYANYGLRGFGLAYSVGGFLSAIQGIILLIIVYLFLKKKVNFFISYCLYMLVLSSIVLTGKSGFSGVIFSLLFLIIYLLWSVFLKPTMFFKPFLFFCLLVISFCIGLMQVKDNTTFSKQAFEFFHSQSSSFVESTRTTDILINKMHFMVSDWTFFFGDGRLIEEDGRSYKHTDAGYMRQILLYGIPGLLIVLSFYFYPMCLVFRKSGISLESIVLLLILLNILVLQIKDNIFFGSFVIIPYFWIAFYFTLEGFPSCKKQKFG
jgi:hypothetical protein